MSEGQENVAQHTLALLRRMDTKLDDVLLRLSMPERRGAPKGEEMTLDRLSVVELRQRIERIERRLDLAG